MTKIKVSDFSNRFNDLVSFSSNKYKSVHRWFSLVEGYSSEFVRRIIGEQSAIPDTCLDPFGGVGTTALVCQELGIKCFSFESNPFFYEVARTKLRSDYSGDEFEILITQFSEYLLKCKGNQKYPDIETKTLFETPKLDRWVFNKNAANAIIDITTRVFELEDNNNKYAKLFKVALGAILLDVSNVFRNGKCLSYKTNWENISISRKEVHNRFLTHCQEIMLVDIRTGESSKAKVHNYVNSFNGDARKLINDLHDNSIDLVITSPPYLNSRDYTDTYRVELWILNYISKFEEEKKIRSAALTSHVQIQLKNSDFPNVKELKNFIAFLNSLNGSLWNKNIPNMIKGYFFDMENLLANLRSKLTPGAKLYINVSNSAYCGMICEVDIIIARIAESLGYKLIDIRLARYIKSSSQQTLKDKIRESIIVLELIK
jgi:DNA modification methylase